MSIATELSTLATNIGNAYDAVSAKSGTLPANKNTNNLATAISSIPSGGGGSVVNGIIAEFKATSSTVDANTFVEFVNNITYGTDTPLSTADQYSYTAAINIGSNKVFVAYGGTNISYPLYGVVCTISGTTITVGSETQIATGNSTNVSAVRLDDDRIFITYGNTPIYGVVCTISGTTITAGSESQIATGSAAKLTASLINEDKVLVTHRSGSYLNGVVCTISGTTITVGADTNLLLYTLSFYQHSVTVLSNDKVCVFYYRSSYFCSIVCTVSGTTITAGSESRLYYLQGSSTPGIVSVLLSENKVFLGFCEGSIAYVTVCTISGTSVTAATLYACSIHPLEGNYCTAKKIGNKVMIIGGGSYLFGQTFFIYNSSVKIVGPEVAIATTTYAGNGVSAAIVGEDVFISHRLASKTGGIICTSSDFTVSTSSTKIEGLTKTECTTSTAGEVWVLNT